MVRSVAIGENITSLNEVHARFNLRTVDDEQFFGEWLDELPEISDQEKNSLDKVKERYLYHRAAGPVAEGAVKMIVVSPLLELAGFYDSPFRIRAEESVQIAVEDRDEVLRGRIDALIVQDRFWVLVVESKRTTFNMDIAIPQALTYMMANPYPDKAVFGLATNGSNFMFIKLVKDDSPQYALSDEFSVYRRRNELYDVLRVLKRIAGAIAP
ncbi:MAG: type I restriction endonuclease subunit R [Iphinoe sp. HA4291-MV1]|jgi:hypothetical protein|nr:type I restriction endonuclease subunit R [Iphinoe sp. HA4291-MV1]